jgi:hypothetical protein
MKQKYVVSASAVIPGSAARAYAVIANYREEHALILPQQLSGLIVEEGGIGAGTVFGCQLRLAGKTQSFRAAVTEPEPGRVLVETLLDNTGTVTTFTVEPGASAKECRVTIHTELGVRAGIPGRIEGFLAARLLHPVYERELSLLAKRVQDVDGSTSQKE